MSFSPRRFRVCLFCFVLAALWGCASKSPEPVDKYRGDVEEMMPYYTPRDDGMPLTSAELHAFKTVSDLDRDLSEEDARIVELHFKFFVHQHRRTFERFLERSARFLPYVKKTFTARGIPEDVAYLFMVESGGNPIARSPAGAGGLWQFMPFTGRKFGLTQNNWIDERRDPFKATYAASDYLLKLYGDFNNWHLAIAAYNAGEGKIGKALSGTGAADFFELCRLDCQLEERMRLKDETRDYVPRLIAVAKIMRNLSRLGFTPPSPGMAWDLRPVDVPPGTNLSGLAKELGLPWDEFTGMNPAFLRTASPPASVATAYVPPDKTVAAVNWMADPGARVYAGWKEYTVKRGDTLASIAKRHGVSAASLRDANGFSKLPGRGSVIMIPGKGASAPVHDARPAGLDASGRYAVQSGDTLSGLARRWGVGVADIRSVNGMGPKETALQVGKKINIPAGGRGQSAPAAQAPKPASQQASQQARQAAPAASAISGASYTVQSGDTVYGIAGRAGVSARELCEANMLDVKKPVIRPGQKLIIPGKGGAAPRAAVTPAAPARQAAPAASQRGARSVTVKAGDTLYGIARANKVAVKDLLKANGLSDKAKLKIGQKLVLP